MRWAATNCPAEAERDPGRNSCTEKTGSADSRYAAPVRRATRLNLRRHWSDTCSTQKRCGLAHQGDFRFMTLFAVLLVLAAGIFRVPRCRRVDSPFANHSGYFFGNALLPQAQMVKRLGSVLIAVISLVMHFFRGRSAAWKQ